MATFHEDTEGRMEIPDCYLDHVSMQLAYDPVKLSLEDDPMQLHVYDRRTLEKIWETKQVEENPFTRRRFDPSKVVPQVQLRVQMREFIQKNFPQATAEDLKVIPDYESPLSTVAMMTVSKEFFSQFLNMVEDPKESSAKAVWQGLNFFRLHYQYHKQVMLNFESINLPALLVSVCGRYQIRSTDENLSEIFYDICREIGMIVHTIGLSAMTHHVFRKRFCVGMNRVAFQLGVKQYSKNKSLSIKLYRMYVIELWEELDQKNNHISVVKLLLDILDNNRKTTEINSEDIWNGMVTLKILDAKCSGKVTGEVLKAAGAKSISNIIKLIVVRMNDSDTHDGDRAMLAEGLLSALYLLNKALLKSYGTYIGNHIRENLRNMEFIDTVNEIAGVFLRMPNPTCQQLVAENLLLEAINIAGTVYANHKKGINRHKLDCFFKILQLQEPIIHPSAGALLSALITDVCSK